MSETGQQQRTHEAGTPLPRPHGPDKTPKWSWTELPRPVKGLFDSFPYHTYPPNRIPDGSILPNELHTLYIFATASGARSGKPSYNPSCLKWQTYLKFQDVKLRYLSSSNHASPTGALPFLLPALSGSDPLPPVPSHRIQQWATNRASPKKRRSQTPQASSHEEENQDSKDSDKSKTSSDTRYEAYLSLIDHRIRDAYLHALYLSPTNFEYVADPLYIQPATSNTLVRIVLRYQLREAAKAELLKQASWIDVEALYRESQKAFSALSVVLGEEEFFSGAEKPSLFDASVFAYTNVLLDEEMQWQDRRLMKVLRSNENLVRHRDRIFARYYSDAT